jgi:hypothetical protein
MRVGGQRHAPTSLPPGRTRYPLSGRVRKILPPPGFDPRTVQPVAGRCTDWAIPARVVYIRKWNLSKSYQSPFESREQKADCDLSVGDSTLCNVTQNYRSLSSQSTSRTHWAPPTFLPALSLLLRLLSRETVFAVRRGLLENLCPPFAE